MNTIITKGIEISVETFYQPEYSNVRESEFMFAYRITIQNLNTYPVQLMRRHWVIHDLKHGYHEVEGEGVVGVQPILAPGAAYQYVSGCNLRSEMGSMKGNYLMENLYDKSQFHAQIPSFHLIAPFKNN